MAESGRRGRVPRSTARHLRRLKQALRRASDEEREPLAAAVAEAYARHARRAAP